MTDTDPPGLDLARLAKHLDGALDVTGPLSGTAFEGGRSNLTYAVTDGEHRWVVRRPPLGHVLPTAHNMSREFRVLSALHPTSVPVPRPLLLCEDTEVLGAPFYVMEFVPGTPYREAAQLEAIGPERTRALALRLVDTLAELHTVDPDAVGLHDFGRPDGFLARQVRRWQRQLEASRSRELPGIDRLATTLADRLPESGPATVLHGDFRLDNALVDENDRVTAVLDWEMSTLGDPLTDLAVQVVYARRDALGIGMTTRGAGSAPGYPGSDELVARYAERSGRDVSGLSWYVAFAFFKLAVIAEGIYYRFRNGQTVGAGFDHVGDMVVPLVEYGLTTLEES